MPLPVRSGDRLRASIAASAAARIVEDQCPWQSARDAALEDAGPEARRANAVPSLQEIESAVREHFAVFCPGEHARVLELQRRCALRILEELFSGMDAYLAGAVLNGAAGPASNIRIEIFTDDPKSAELRLLDSGIDWEGIEPERGPMPEPLECLGFLVRIPGLRDLQGVRVDVHDVRSLGRNPWKREPDARQSPWEARGRITGEALRAALEAGEIPDRG